jgi:hypothetical protein
MIVRRRHLPLPWQAPHSAGDQPRLSRADVGRATSSRGGLTMAEQWLPPSLGTWHELVNALLHNPALGGGGGWKTTPYPPRISRAPRLCLRARPFAMARGSPRCWLLQPPYRTSRPRCRTRVTKPTSQERRSSHRSVHRRLLRNPAATHRLALARPAPMGLQNRLTADCGRELDRGRRPP